MISKKYLFPAILALALLFKFWLISGFEITDDGDDPVEYVEQINSHGGLCYGPGTGDVGRAFQSLGIPFRIGIEIIFLIVALLAVMALLDWPTRSGLALGVYLVVIFNPALEELLSHLMSDQVCLVETMAGFSFLVFSAGATSPLRWYAIALAAVSFGFAVITRSTFMPLLAIFLLCGFLSGLLALTKAGRKVVTLPLISGVLVCLFAMFLFYYSTCYVDSRANGFFGINAFDSREFQHFYVELQSVGDPTGDAYFPIDDDRLHLIATAGPRSAWFADRLEKEGSFREVSRATYGKPGIALCWFHWAVFETVNIDGDLPKTFAVFHAIEDEISQAAREGRLKVRRVLPLPDCRVPIVLSALPAASYHVASLLVFQPKHYAWAIQGEPRFINPKFTLALTRSPVVPSPVRDKIGTGLCAIYGFLYTPLLPTLVVAVVAFVVTLVRRWRKVPPLSARFLAQQLFLIAFVVFYLWYTLFDASGLWAVPRYLIYGNVMLPTLIVYYARGVWRLWKNPSTYCS